MLELGTDRPKSLENFETKTWLCITDCGSDNRIQQLGMHSRPIAVVGSALSTLLQADARQGHSGELLLFKLEQLQAESATIGTSPLHRAEQLLEGRSVICSVKAWSSVVQGIVQEL